VTSKRDMIRFWTTKSSGLHHLATLQTHRQPPPPSHTHKARVTRGIVSEANESITICISQSNVKVML